MDHFDDKFSEVHRSYYINTKRREELRIAAILDELTEEFLAYECEVVNLESFRWKDQLKDFYPDFFLAESIWNGHNKTWRRKLTPQIHDDFLRLMQWFKERGIPTIFWNKEDPVHMHTFLKVASLFDYVYTTDVDCVPLYMRLLGHRRVGFLPFATSTHLFNPIEEFDRKDCACFAGSYYRKREERKLAFENIADALSKEYCLEIYDRNSYPGNLDYQYPERFQNMIKGSLPVDQINVAYKGYRFGVTLNIVNHSSTMEARRIFELLGSNTLTISNDCLGVRNLFGDLVLYYENQEQFNSGFRSLLQSPEKAEKIRLLALRKILKEHTYRHWLENLYNLTFGVELSRLEPKVAVFSVVNNEDELINVIRSYNRQSYQSKQLFVFNQKPNKILAKDGNSYPGIEELNQVLPGDHQFLAYLAPNNYYGDHYLEDLVLTAKLVEISAIGKSSHFCYENNKVTKKADIEPYNYTDRMRLDRCLFKPHLLGLIKTGNIEECWFNNIPCFSTDLFNFCENWQKETCGEVDDLDLYCGHSLSELLDLTKDPELLAINYSFKEEISGQEMGEAFKINHYLLDLINLPKSAIGFFVKHDNNSFTNAYVDLWKDVSPLIEYDELSERNIMSVYLSAEFVKEVNFYITLYTINREYISSYLLQPKTYSKIPVPSNAHYFCFRLRTRGWAYGIIKEILINPTITNPIINQTSKRG